MARRRRSRRRIEKALPAQLAQNPGGQIRTAEEVMAGIRGQTETGLAKPLPRDTYPYEFGPNIPLIPAPLDPPRRRSGRAEPRLWEYPVGWNLPGTGLGRLVPWKTLRDAANLPLIRDCIRIRKSEVQGLEWDFTLTRRAVDRAMRERPDASRLDVERELRDRLAADVDRAVDFWSVPDRGNGYTFAEWITQALEEHLVLDRPAIYPRYTLGGDLNPLGALHGPGPLPALHPRRRPVRAGGAGRVDDQAAARPPRWPADAATARLPADFARVPPWRVHGRHLGHRRGRRRGHPGRIHRRPADLHPARGP